MSRLKGRPNPHAKALKKRDAEWRRLCSAITRDSVRVCVPRAFLSTLTLFFHHVSDAMAGDDRPDHGLAMMRQGRDYYRLPFYFLYGKLRRAEKRVRGSQYRRALGQFHRYQELSKEYGTKGFEESMRPIDKTTARYHTDLSPATGDAGRGSPTARSV